MELVIYHFKVDCISTMRSVKCSLKNFFSQPWGKRIKVDLLPALVRETAVDRLETSYDPDTQH